MLAWQFYMQEFTQPHQRLLRWVQGVLLLFIVTLSLSSHSIQEYLQQNLQGLLGADAVISQKQPLSAEQLKEVSLFVDKVAMTQQIQTMLTYQGNWQQAQLKAVDHQYPLQGELVTSTSLQGIGETSLSGPEVGHMWIDARLMASLSLDIGDEISIANKAFTVSRLLQHEPDRLMEGHSVAMRAMINASDMQQLGFSNDLIRYRYLMNANTQQIDELIAWQQENLPAAVLHHKQGKHPLALFWQRTENFMGLASIILFFMAAIAIEQLSQVFMRKEQFFSAVCLSLGASKSTGIQVSIYKWLIGILLLIPIVIVFSTAFHWLIINFLKETFVNLAWQWQLPSMFKPISFVIVVFAIFNAPVWFATYRSSIAQQFRGKQTVISHWLSKLCSILALCIVAFVYSDNGLLTLMMVSAIMLTIALMVVISWGSLTLGESVTQHVSGLFPFALFMMKQRLLSKSTQILGIGLCAFLLLFTLMLLKDLGASMSAYQRQHDGNAFISQASQKQMSFVEDWSEEHNIRIRQVKPYMHAKLIEVNGQSLAEFSDKPSESLATLSKSIRLHWSKTIPTNNRVVEGRWWQEKNTNWQQVSIEQEVMTDLGLQLGDELAFFINNKSYTFEITASHEFKPGAGSITFWVQMPPSALTHIQASQYYMASIELDEAQWSLLAPLWQKFPTLRMVSLKEITQRFDKTLAMITKVISGFSLMIILLAGVVILASINALESKEKKKNSVIMSFGFSRATCLKLNIIEWLVTAFITAIGAILGTYIAGQLIYQSQFSLNYNPNFIWLALTLLMILSLTTALGVWASRSSLKSSIRQLISNT